MCGQIRRKDIDMLYSYDASSKKNSTMQILSGVVKEVNADTVVVNVPLGYNKQQDFTINTADLQLANAPVVGNAISAIGLEGEEGVFEVDETLQKTLAQGALQFHEFDRVKTKSPATPRPKEHDIFMVFPLSKVTQIMVNEEKKNVAIPAGVGDKTVWLRFWGNKINKFDDYTEDGKKRLGMKAYAEMFKKKLETLKEDEVLLVPYAGIFEQSEKQEDGSYKSFPAQPTEADGKLSYNVFAQGQNALNQMLNGSMVVPKASVFARKPETAPVPTTEQELSEEEEMALLNQALG